LTCLPYLVAWQVSPSGTKYTGLLVNHYDGESYYAKMQQGARGDWLFHLAFTPEPHEGAFIFTFYMALGQLAGALGMPVPLVYHLARAATGLFLLLVAYQFIARFFERLPARHTAALLLGFSAGFGWLVAPLGLITADLWVAEGFTFLSILANPHFPLAIGLMLLLFLSVLDSPSSSRHGARLVGAAGLGLLLAVIQPFAVPVVASVLGVYLSALTLHARRLPWRRALVAMAGVLGAAPIMLYDFYVYNKNSALAAWSAQNLTPSLPPWEYLLGYGLVAILAAAGISFVLRRRTEQDLFLLCWIGTAALLLYIPFDLQRRFITGLHVPLVLLAALGLERIILPQIRPARRSLATVLVVGISALTNLFVPAISVAGIARGQPPLLMSDTEAAAYTWLGEHTAWTDTVLAPVDSGQFVPAWAGNRVVYGHPFETIEAERKESEVDAFFADGATATERRALLDRYSVRYVLVLSPDTNLNPAGLGLDPAWSQEGAMLYRVGAGP
jgi:hypothetical protein